VRANLVWPELDWTGLDWTGLDWTGLDYIFSTTSVSRSNSCKALNQQAGKI